MPKKSSKKQMISFQEKVYEVVRKIPKGKVLSYKQVAELAGNPRAWRAVGNILRHSAELSRSHKNPSPIIIPCHQVIKSNGEIGGYKGGIKKKIYLLKKEGMIINPFGKLRVDTEQSRSIKNGEITS